MDGRGWGEEIGSLVYIGIDGSLSTLYVEEQYRGRGLATCVAKELVRRLGRGEFKEMGYGGETGWIHAEVSEGLAGSEAVMRSIGAKLGWPVWVVYIDLENL